MLLRTCLLFSIAASTQLLCKRALAQDAERTTRQNTDYFETHIRPLLIKNCLECHAADTEASGGLLLDSGPNWQAGGDSGAAIVPGNPDASLLMKAIAYDDPDLQMPPEGKLPEEAIAAVREWILTGAVDPRSEAIASKSKSQGLSVEEAAKHWAYRPIELSNVPSEDGGEQRDAVSPIDAFVSSRLAQSGLQAAGPVTRTQLIRRLTFDLTGLPPTPEQIAAFTEDNSDEAIERVVDRLLDSPRFGETFARHWMDVARYAESVTLRGFVLPQAWRYRDYLIAAYNEDRPFDQMIVEQIAGDLLNAKDIEERRKQMVATGFLAFGNTNLEEQDKTQLDMDYIDEQLEVLGRAFLGQTIGCARCHDHKFDPIPTRDYYALAGIFRNTTAMVHSNVSKWIEQPLPLEPDDAVKFATIEAELKEVEQQISALKPNSKASNKKGAKSVARSVLPGVVIDDEAALLKGDWTTSASVAGFVDLGYRHDGNDKGSSKQATFEVKTLATGTYRVRMSYTTGANRATNTKVIVFSADGETTLQINQRQDPPEDGMWVSLGDHRFEANGPAFVTISNEEADGHVVIDAVQFLLQDVPPGIPAVTAAVAQVAAPKTDPNPNNAAEALAKTAEQLKKLEAEQKRLKAQLAERPQFLTITEKTPAKNLAIHIRGNVHNLGEVVPRGVLTALSVNKEHGAVEFDETSSGRLQLAKWIADHRNPLTARVYANRVWSWMIGQGIVASTNNFGTTGAAPTHPELLDWLANELMRSGWSTKHLVRCIALSDVYRRSVISAGETEQGLDPNNQLLWRGNLRRISVESMRDAMLQASGELQLSVGGSTLKSNTNDDYNYAHSGSRRSVYQPILRNSLPELFEAFDFADTSVSIGERSNSTVAPQALLMMNHPWVIARATAAANRISAECSSPALAIERAYSLCIGRSPTAEEAAACATFITGSPDQAAANQSLDKKRLSSLVQSLMASLDFRYLE